MTCEYINSVPAKMAHILLRQKNHKSRAAGPVSPELHQACGSMPRHVDTEFRVSSVAHSLCSESESERIHMRLNLTAKLRDRFPKTFHRLKSLVIGPHSNRTLLHVTRKYCSRERFHACCVSTWRRDLGNFGNRQYGRILS